MQLNQYLLGYFLLVGNSSSCIIIDWNYGSLCLDYGLDDQIIIPTQSHLGYIRPGVCFDIAITFDKEVELSSNIEIIEIAENN